MEIPTGSYGYGLPFLAILTVLVFVHELGHYLIARLNGVRVEVFSIGFGPELFGWTDKAKTRWKFSIIPLGGYVKMFGDLNASSMPDQKQRRRFIAGAVCPRCGEMDRIVVDLDTDQRECVSCGFSDARPPDTAPQAGEVPTRVSRAAARRVGAAGLSRLVAGSSSAGRARSR